MKLIIKVFTIFVLFLLPILTIGQSEKTKTTIYGYKHPKSKSSRPLYYFQDRDIPYGDSMVNDAFKKYNMLIILEQGIWSNIPLKDKPRIKNGCYLIKIEIYKNEKGKIIFLEELVE